MGCGTSVDVKEFKYQREAHLSLRKSSFHGSDTLSPTCSPWTYSVYTTTTDGRSLTGESWPSDSRLRVVSVATLGGHSEPETVHRQKNKIFLHKQSKAGHNVERTGVIRKIRSDETGSDVTSQQTDTPSASQSYPVIPGTIEQGRPRRDKLMTLECNRDTFTHLKCEEESTADNKDIRHTVSMEEAARGYNITLDPPIRSQVLSPDDNKIDRLRRLFTAEGSLVRGSIGLNYSPISIDDSIASDEMDDSEEIVEGHFHQPVTADFVTAKEAGDIDRSTLDCQAGQVELRLKLKPSDVPQSSDDIVQGDVGLVDRDQDDNMSVVAEGFETPSVLSLLDHVDHGASDKSDPDDDTSELTSLHSVSSHSSLGDMDNWIEEGYYPMAECDPSGIERPLRDDRSSSSLPHAISELFKPKTLSKAKTTSSNPAIAQPNNFVNLLKLPKSSHRLGLGDHKLRSSTLYHHQTSSPTLQPPLYTDMSDNSNNCGTARPTSSSAVIHEGGGSPGGAISMVSGDNNDSCEEMTSCSNIHLHENFFNDFGDNFDDEDFRRL